MALEKVVALLLVPSFQQMSPERGKFLRTDIFQMKNQPTGFLGGFSPGFCVISPWCWQLFIWCCCCCGCCCSCSSGCLLATLCCPLGCVPVDFWRFRDAERRYEATADAPPDEFDEFEGMLLAWGFLVREKHQTIKCIWGKGWTNIRLHYIYGFINNE